MNTIELIESQVTTEVATLTLEEGFFQAFINYLDVSPATIKMYSSGIKQFFKYIKAIGEPAPDRQTVLAYKAYLSDTRNLKPTTVQNYIVALKQFFKWTASQNIYPNISDNVKGAKISKEHKKDYLASQQVKEILSNLASNCDTEIGLRNYALFTLMVTGGARAIEMARADVGDIKTNGDNVVIYIQGKGKHEKSDYITLSDKVEKIIKTYLMMRGAKDDEPLFASTSNNNKGKRMTTRSISSIIKASMVNSGYDSERLTAHSLRHTAVTLSLLNGESLQEVQQFARHTNIATTQIYAHNIEKSKNKCSNTIADAIF